MMESTFFYTGVIAFSMMVTGLALTILEFSNLRKSQKSKITDRENFGGQSDTHAEDEQNSRLKVVNPGQL